jgi:hypothetical protein
MIRPLLLADNASNGNIGSIKVPNVFYLIFKPELPFIAT